MILDKGAQAGVEPGQAVVDDVGVIGQITRVFPMQSELTLLTDKDQAIPVIIVRSGLAGGAVRLGNGLMELRYLAANADIQPGDKVVTSGLDGVFLAGPAGGDSGAGRARSGPDLRPHPLPARRGCRAVQPCAGAGSPKALPPRRRSPRSSTKGRR